MLHCKNDPRKKIPSIFFPPNMGRTFAVPSIIVSFFCFFVFAVFSVFFFVLSSLLSGQAARVCLLLVHYTSVVAVLSTQDGAAGSG